MGGIAGRAVLVVRARRLPVTVHLREGADVEAIAGPRVDLRVQLEQEVVVLSHGEALRRSRLVCAVCAGVQRKQRDRAHRGDDLREMTALVEAHERVVDLAVLPRLRGEAVGVTEDAEDHARRCGGRGRERQQRSTGGKERAHGASG